ncbi:spore germination protein [Desulfofarcimen acetoxidans DSM 771]|jgi:spore germination protein KB|uniref:Spore germination protein n=1 Tax=Desulfofarcimen acetoxidans (strain ATCC 49208 / DSM 771 / KCTC 5769 / VKM B-1644 / 5575) TaxID=485916 RepID=C8W226_DESAS|nr:endospore germination permease [Desulfofarcimen acetoxidans]ACV61690.1 spore germination protein [Desulfofarcimen acetoxidans DSM 771]
MLEKGKISCSQTILLLINLVTATATMFIPSVSTAICGRDAWLASLIATLPGIYQVIILCTLGKIYPGQTIIQYLQTVLSAWPGKILGLCYIFFFLHTNAFIIREFSELITNTIMPHTPNVVFISIMVLICAYAIGSGLEVLSRVIEITIFIIIIIVIILVALTAQAADLNNLLPLLDNNPMPILNASLVHFAWRGEVILLAMFLPFLAKPNNAMRCGIVAQLLVGILISVDTVAMIAVLGSDQAATLTFSTYSLIRDYSIGRADAFIIIIWMVSLFGKIALFYYVTVLGTAQLFNLKSYRIIVLPLGVLMAAFSITVAENNVQLVEYMSKTFPPFAYVFEYIIPTIIFIIARVTKARKSP